MTRTIHLTQEETRRHTAAQKEGRDPVEFVQRPTHDENAASMALRQSWLAEDATDKPDEVRQAQKELELFKQAINAKRARAGTRPIYP